MVSYEKLHKKLRHKEIGDDGDDSDEFYKKLKEYFNKKHK